MVTHAALALIGSGVRGTAALGRIAARLRSAPPEHPLIVHVIDPYPAGSGSIWRADQPHTLVMNTVAAQSTVFDDPTLGFEASFPGPNFAEWCERVAKGEVATEDTVSRRLAAETRPWSSPSRALYGAYLRWAHRTFAAALPAQVSLQVHRDRAIDIARSRDEYLVTLVSGTKLSVRAAILALGWIPRGQGTGTDIGPASPIDQPFDDILPGERVAVRGLGMGFTDLLSLVTEGRGGAFEPDPQPGRPYAVKYLRSEREPVLLAGSRSGLPFLAKPAFEAVPPPATLPSLTRAMPELLARRPLDFAKEVLPLIERDSALTHYRVLAEHRPEAFTTDPARLLALIDAADDSAVGTTWRDAAREWVPAPRDRFDTERIGRPICGSTPEQIDAAIAARITQDAGDASEGLRSARKRGLHVYQAARVAIVPLTDFGGVTPESLASLNRYLTLAGLVGSGPPLFRVEQLLALHRAGIVRFIGPGLSVKAHEGNRFVSSSLTNGVGFEIDRVIDAHLTLPNPKMLGDPLLDSLLRHGTARLWNHPQAESTPTLEISAKDSALIDADGAPNAGLFSLGPLHEQIRRFTIIAPIPNARSTVLREIDSAVAAAVARVTPLTAALQLTS
ncbi:FAD/NAD(P)-binding protein [Leucobacter sp. W1153]|uniref:FAD/NAD(P)-binding protein n=1 Tax=Leucobacter sp. W1153 TaxID=3439064 RepID=UPI003F35A588